MHSSKVPKSLSQDHAIKLAVKLTNYPRGYNKYAFQTTLELIQAVDASAFDGGESQKRALTLALEAHIADGVHHSDWNIPEQASA